MKKNRLTFLFIIPLFFVSCEKEISEQHGAEILQGKWVLKVYESTYAIVGNDEISNILTENLPYEYLIFDGKDSASLRLTTPYFIGSDGTEDITGWNPAAGKDLSLTDYLDTQSREPIYYLKYFYRLEGNRLLLKERIAYDPYILVKRWRPADEEIDDYLKNYYAKIEEDRSWWDISLNGNSLKLQREIGYRHQYGFRSKVTMSFSRE